MSFSQSFCGHILYDLIFPAMSQEVELRSPKSIGAPCKPKDEDQGPHKRYLSDATDATKHFLEEKMNSGFCEVCMVKRPDKLIYHVTQERWQQKRGQERGQERAGGTRDIRGG